MTLQMTIKGQCPLNRVVFFIWSFQKVKSIITVVLKSIQTMIAILLLKYDPFIKDVQSGGEVFPKDYFTDKAYLTKVMTKGRRDQISKN